VTTKELVWWWLSRKKIWRDNLLYRQIKDTDTVTHGILQKLNSHKTEIQDKILRRYVDKLPEGSHAAYSYVVFCKFTHLIFQKLPVQTTILFKRERQMIDYLNSLHGKINDRIQQLLDGAEDER
jgi:hypothetical protein